ncbi:MAG: hypothetical protein ABR567_16445 [Myxococcales bacterium]|nr:hypothetical protein [Myxococcales bacterium]
MKRLLVAIFLCSAGVSAEDTLSGHVGLFGIGALAGNGAGFQITPIEVEFEKGEWMFGGGGVVGAIGNGVLIGSIGLRGDRFLHDGWYGGARAGWLIAEDTESYGGQGAFIGAQAGYLFGRTATWGRVGIEVQGALPLFKPRADKPGSVVFPLGGLAVRFLL